jgi:hypothetical protein
VRYRHDYSVMVKVYGDAIWDGAPHFRPSTISVAYMACALAAAGMGAGAVSGFGPEPV